WPSLYIHFFPNDNWIKLQLEDCDQLSSNSIPRSDDDVMSHNKSWRSIVGHGNSLPSDLMTDDMGTKRVPSSSSAGFDDLIPEAQRSHDGIAYVAIMQPDFFASLAELGYFYDLTTLYRFEPQTAQMVAFNMQVSVYMGDERRMDFSHCHFDIFSPPKFYTKKFIKEDMNFSDTEVYMRRSDSLKRKDESFEIWSRRQAQLLCCSTGVTLKEFIYKDNKRKKKTRLEAATKASKNARRRAEVQVEGKRKIDFEKEAARQALLKPTNSASPILLYDAADAIQGVIYGAARVAEVSHRPGPFRVNVVVGTEVAIATL
ncbi:hypothetical protein Tco_1129016, partial [Tanacetum coccineum]